MECGGKREYGRKAALAWRDFCRTGIPWRLCKVKSGVAAALCHRAPQKRRRIPACPGAGLFGKLAK